MATPKKLPSGNWRVQVFSHIDGNGKRKYVSITAPSKAEALRRAAEYAVNKANDDAPQDITVAGIIKSYIDSRSNLISPKTLMEYEKCARLYYHKIENIKLGSLTRLILQDYVNDLATRMSPKSVRNIYGLLRVALKMYTDRNFNITLPPKEILERHIPTDADIALMMSKANPTLKIAIALGAQGMRRGEICSLKYGDILRDFNAIYIHSDMVLGKEGWVYKPRPKTAKSTRRLILPKELIDMLGDGNPDDFILGVKPSTITTDFINLRNKLGLQCRFHDTRHYSVSIMHALGLPDAYIMEHNGYSSDMVMKDVYRHTLSDKVDNYTNIANEYFKKNILESEHKKTDSDSNAV